MKNLPSEQPSNTLASLQWPNKSDARRSVSRAPIAAVKSESESESSLLIAAADATFSGVEQAIASPRECDCQRQYATGRYDNLVRCVHVDTERIALVADSGFDDRFVIQRWSDGNVLWSGHVEADALAAFYAAEAELLGRAP